MCLKLFGGCLVGIWRVSGGYGEGVGGVWRLSGRCLEAV